MMLIIALNYCCCWPAEGAPIFDSTSTTASASAQASALASFTLLAALTVRHSVERSSLLNRYTPERPHLQGRDLQS